MSKLGLITNLWRTWIAKTAIFSATASLKQLSPEQLHMQLVSAIFFISTFYWTYSVITDIAWKAQFLKSSLSTNYENQNKLNTASAIQSCLCLLFFFLFLNKISKAALTSTYMLTYNIRQKIINTSINSYFLFTGITTMQNNITT